LTAAFVCAPYLEAVCFWLENELRYKLDELILGAYLLLLLYVATTWRVTSKKWSCDKLLYFIGCPEHTIFADVST
jgi:hypothetical protein